MAFLKGGVSSVFNVCLGSPGTVGTHFQTTGLGCGNDWSEGKEVIPTLAWSCDTESLEGATNEIGLENKDA